MILSIDRHTPTNIGGDNIYTDFIHSPPVYTHTHIIYMCVYTYNITEGGGVKRRQC